MMTTTSADLKELIAVLKKSGREAMKKKSVEIARKNTSRERGKTSEDDIQDFARKLIAKAKKEHPDMYNDAVAASRSRSKDSSVAGSEGSEADIKKVKKESIIQTPEQENALYESRFTDRNTRLFDKLLKIWTK